MFAIAELHKGRDCENDDDDKLSSEFVRSISSHQMETTMTTKIEEKLQLRRDIALHQNITRDLLRTSQRATICGDSFSRTSRNQSARSSFQNEHRQRSLNRRNDYVAIDMTTMTPNRYSQSNFSAVDTTASTCCHCLSEARTANPRKSRPSSTLHDLEEYGNQELSWRRLHMSRAKLKAAATTSELLSGFAMVAMVELQLEKGNMVPIELITLFVVCTTVLVSLHIFALMISTYLLPNVDAISKLQISRLIVESPHEQMRGFIELAWVFSTILGLFLFLVEIVLISWVKFWHMPTAAIAGTIIIIPVLFLFVLFAGHFYRSLVVSKCQATVSHMEELEKMKKNLDDSDNVTTSV